MGLKTMRRLFLRFFADFREKLLLALPLKASFRSEPGHGLRFAYKLVPLYPEPPGLVDVFAGVVYTDAFSNGDLIVRE